MDDFLHNLRSGKLKQDNRSRGNYSDYKGPQRRAAGNERRRTDYYTKVTGENFALVKDALDALGRQQKRIADALADRADVESRIAEALETIARKLGAGRATAAAPVQTTVSDGDWGSSLTTQDHPKLIRLIAAMREEGLGWEKIARDMIEKGVPTVSGKGIWRGASIKKFWETHTEASGA
jgi:hypothetical protein